MNIAIYQIFKVKETYKSVYGPNFFVRNSAGVFLI